MSNTWNTSAQRVQPSFFCLLRSGELHTYWDHKRASQSYQRAWQQLRLQAFPLWPCSDRNLLLFRWKPTPQQECPRQAWWKTGFVAAQTRRVLCWNSRRPAENWFQTEDGRTRDKASLSPDWLLAQLLCGSELTAGRPAPSRWCLHVAALFSRCESSLKTQLTRLQLSLRCINYQTLLVFLSQVQQNKISSLYLLLSWIASFMDSWDVFRKLDIDLYVLFCQTDSFLIAESWTLTWPEAGEFSSV